MLSVRRNIWTAASLLLLALLSAQTMIGDHGLKANAALKVRIAGLTKQLKILEEKRQSLETVAKRLSSGSIDADTLEGEARRLLNFVYPNERIQLHSDLDR